MGFRSAIVALAGAIGYIIRVPLQIFSITGPLPNSILAFASSLIIATPFLISMVALHYSVSED